MEYKISNLKDLLIIKITGPLDRSAIYSVSTFLKPLLNEKPKKIILDIIDLKDEYNHVFQIGLVNAFKKVIDQAGGALTVRADQSKVRQYLIATRIEQLFNFSFPNTAKI